MACCKCCCGNEDCSEGQQGKCCCGGAEGTCCSETQYCCDGECSDEPCSCETDADCGCVVDGYTRPSATCTGGTEDVCCPDGYFFVDDISNPQFGNCVPSCGSPPGYEDQPSGPGPTPKEVCCDGVCEELCPPP
jgi:hypothetical protein